MKVKINFDEAQKLTWKELKCLYGLIKIITPNHISELLKMQLESRSRNVYTKGTRSGFFSTHAVTTQWSFIVLFLVGSVTCSPHIDRSGQDSPTTIFFFQLQYFSPDSRLTRTKTEIPIRSVQNADCRPGTKCRLQTEKFILFSTFFSNSHHDKSTSFLITQLPKNKREFIP